MEFTLQVFIATNVFYITTFVLYRFYNQKLENDYKLLINEHELIINDYESLSNDYETLENEANDLDYKCNELEQDIVDMDADMRVLKKTGERIGRMYTVINDKLTGQKIELLKLRVQLRKSK